MANIAAQMRPVLMIVVVALAIELVTPKQINITVMVPGRKAFRNLYAVVQRLNSSLYDYDGTADIADAGPTIALDDYISDCLDFDAADINVECVQYLQDYVTYSWSYLFAKPALDIAMETIKRSEGLLDGFDIALRYYDSGDDQGKASVRSAQIAAVDSMVLDHMAALIGPMNPYAVARVSSLTAHWEKLNLSPGAISINLKGKETETEPAKNTLIRTGPVASGVGDCVASILRFYNWTSTAVQVFEDGGMERYHYFMMEGVFDRVNKAYPGLELNQIRLSEYKNIDYETGLQYNYPVAFREAKRQGRVLIISAEADTVLEMLTQAIANEHRGDYVYLIIDLGDQLGPTPWKYKDENGSEVVDDALRKILKTALVVTLPKERTRQYEKFVHSLGRRLGRDLFEDLDPKLARYIGLQLAESESARYGAGSLEQYFKKNQYPAYLHDSLLMLAHVLNNTLHLDNTSSHPEGAFTTGSRESPTPSTDGSRNAEELIDSYVANKEFQGVSGKMAFDEKGDRMFDFVVLHYSADEDEFREVGNFHSTHGRYSEHSEVDWPEGTPPPDVPKCGFDGSKCSEPGLSTLHSTLIAVAVIVVLFAIGIATYGFRSYKLQKELESQLWRVHKNDITWSVSPDSILSGTMDWITEVERARASESDPSLADMMSYFVPSMSPGIAAKRAHKRKRKWSSNSKKNDRVFDNERKTSAGSLISERAWGGLTTIGLYKDKTVVLKLTNRKKVELTREILMELKHMRDVTHEHLTRFEGACLEWPHICILTEYCGKGSLKDILLNEEITMDWMFRVSLMNDLVKGMRFLHGSAINCHGNLKSTNCVVDSRFVLKITDYGLKSFRNLPTAVESERECEKKLWTAPELLRCNSNTFTGTQKGDVYSFGIILQEIALRKGPFYVGGIPLTCREIISKVRCGFPPYFRPMADLSILSEDMCNLMQKCWNEDPNERPDFILTQKIIERFNRENPGNLVENLLHRMEQYAINLEGLVEERTAAYMEEKQKADDLLYQMLPVPVVDRLKRGDAVPAEAFESVTICFTDIVGFTSLSAASSPMQIVSLLNDLYTCFDAIIDNFDVYKVETIGDAYMLVSGLPVRNGIRHAREIARTALALLRAVSNFKIRHRPGDQLKLRIGIHTGPCCAGVVGLKMPRYCLFGDTVNTASRMESSGSPLAIHVSDSTKKLLDRYQSFQLQLRGDVPMKGKGALTTYWLVGEVTDDVKSIPEKESCI